MMHTRLVAIEWKRWDRRRNRPPRCLLSLIVEHQSPTGRRHYRVRATVSARSIEARVVETARTVAGVTVWLPALRRRSDVVAHVLDVLPAHVRHIMQTAEAG